MAVTLTDTEIENLIAEMKPLPADYRQKVKLNQKRGHKERELEIERAGGGQFVLILRQSAFNPLDFSIILAWTPPHSTTRFRLCRYNGKSHEHTNTLESRTFYDVHIHRATERYQQSGLREDSYAEATPRYQDIGGALQCAIADCGFRIAGDDTMNLFDTEGAT